MKCVKCGFSDHVEGAEYCQECGAKLPSYYCMNPNCPSEGKIYLPENAIYCPYCGDKLTANDGLD